MMPGAGALERQLIHTRQVVCQGFLRADGLWDIVGCLQDSKTHAAKLITGVTVEAGQTYHGMRITLTLDDEFTIHAVDVAMPHTPTAECHGAAPAYDQLVGLRIGPGFMRQVKELFGGPRGCIHLSELLQPMATTAIQTIPMARAMVAPRNARDADAFARATKGLPGTCYAMRKDGPLMVYFAPSAAAPTEAPPDPETAA